jgi:2-polyprenyl-3-methyl-5-hydroxy-6-metoxy-1,4-benzoquinol methylase
VRLGLIPESPVERVVARLDAAPRPLLETQIAFTLARLVMAGVRLGVFDAVGEDTRTSHEVAERCGTDPRATGKLMFGLAAAGYLEEREGGYRTTPTTRKWILADSSSSLADKLLFQFHEWEWMERTEDFVRTGAPLELHRAIGGAEWGDYQRAMRAVAGGAAREAARRLPVPRGARDMLDIGGSHGHLSATVCRRHEDMRAVVLDLPEAVEHAAPLLAEEGMGERVVHRAGDALSDDLGSDAYDLVVTAQLVHHFTDEQNRDLARRVARALRPGGVYAIIDMFSSRSAKDAGQVPALLEFYFALTSESGTWSPDEMAEWQRGAGLEPRRPIRFRTLPGSGIQAAFKRG